MEPRDRGSIPRLLPTITLGLALVGLVGSVWLALDNRYQRAEFLRLARLEAQGQMDWALARVSLALGSLKPLGERIAEALETAQRSPEEIVDLMETTLRENPEVYELGVASEPFAVDPEDPMFSPSFDRKQGPVRGTPRSTYDYREPDNPDTEWYRQALKATSAIWQEPYCDGLSCYAEYAIPFRTPLADPAGVVYINRHPADLGKFLETLEIGATGYGMILSRSGKLVSHPNTQWVVAGRSLAEISREAGDPGIADLAERAAAGERGVSDHTDPTSGQRSWVFYEPIPGTDWSLVVVYIQDHILRQRDARFYHRHLLQGLTILVTIFGLGALVAQRLYPQYGTRCLWGISLLASLLLLVAIALVWRAVLSGARDPQWGVSHGAEEASTAKGEDGPIRLVSVTGVRSYLSDLERLALAAGEPVPTPLETGVFVQSLEFQNSYNVFMTGYVWQRVLSGIHDGIVPGFELPEAVSPVIELDYERPLPDFDSDGNPDGRLLGWYFEALLRQSFDYSRYPFDDKSVWIRFWPRELDASVVLTPLFESYSQIKPSRLPGIEQDFVLPGWELRESYFAYRDNRYNVDFGFPRSKGPQWMPELYFHIDIRRDFMNAFISNLVPLISVVIILYTLLLIITSDRRRADLHGFNTAGILGSAAALFFSVLIGHVQLRDQFQVQEVMYLEHFYFVVYFLVLGVSLDALLFSVSTENSSWIRRHDNLIMKIAYWPLILGALCVITLWTFS